MEVEKELKRLIIRKVELESLREKMRNLLVNPSNLKSVVFNASMCTKYSKNDIPKIVSDICNDKNPHAPKLICKNIFAAYIELLEEKYNEAQRFISEYHNGHTDKNEMMDACLLKLCELSVLFNSCTDLMIEKIHSMNLDVNSICDTFDKRMYSIYFQTGEKLVRHYIGVVYAS